MPNTFITMQAVARRALATLYNTTVLAGLVYRDYDPDFAGKVGDTITVRKPAVFTADEFDRNAGIQLQDATETGLPVTLDTILDVSFAVTTEDLTLKIDDFAGRLLNPAMEAINQAVDAKLGTLLTDVSIGSVNEIGPQAIVEAGRYLSVKKVPKSGRSAVFSPRATADLLRSNLFVAVQESGSTDGLREASIGRKFGFDNYESQVFATGGVAFHNTAVALVSRTLQAPAGVDPSRVAIENYKGLGVRVVYQYDINKKQDVVSIDMLTGFKIIDANRAVKVDVVPQGS